MISTYSYTAGTKVSKGQTIAKARAMGVPAGAGHFL